MKANDLKILFLVGTILASLMFCVSMQLIGTFGFTVTRSVYAAIQFLVGCFNWYMYLKWRDRSYLK